MYSLYRRPSIRNVLRQEYPAALLPLPPNSPRHLVTVTWTGMPCCRKRVISAFFWAPATKSTIVATARATRHAEAAIRPTRRASTSTPAPRNVVRVSDGSVSPVITSAAPSVRPASPTAAARSSAPPSPSDRRARHPAVLLPRRGERSDAVHLRPPRRFRPGCTAQRRAGRVHMLVTRA